MAVGNIVSVEDLPTGGYNFVDKTGAKKMLFGPDADEFAARVRASEALERGTQPTAQVTQDDLVQGAGGFGGFGGQVSQPNLATDAPAPVPGLEKPPASIAREQTPEAAPQQQSQAQPGARFSDGEGGIIQQNADGTWSRIKTTAPSKGGMIEKSRSIAGGFDASKEYIGATEQAFKGQAEAQATGAEIAVQEAQLEQSYLAEQQRQNALAIEQQQKQQQTIQDGIRQKQAEYDMINERYKTQKVDPFRGMGTFQKVLLAVSSALGAFGAGMARSPNFTQQMIDGFIERNVREQEREIAVKREQAQNTLADLEKRLGSMDLAKAALGAMMRERVQLGLQSQMAGLKGPKAVAAFQDANAKLTQAYADKLEEYRQKAGGQVTRSIVNMPGSAGGTTETPLTIDQAAKVKNLYGGDGQKPTQGVGSERTTKIADNAQAIMQADELAGMLQNEGDSEFWEPGTPGVRSIPGTDEYSKQKQLEQKTQAAITTNQKAAGIGSTEDDRKNVERGLIGGGSVAERRRGAEALAEEAAARIAAEVATLPPDQQKTQLEALPPQVRARVGRALAR